MASDPYTLRLNLKDEISGKPSLYILSVGINKYRDKSLWLNYAVPDSKDIVTSIQNTASPIFETITVSEILDKDPTFEGIKDAFKNVSEQIKNK